MSSKVTLKGLNTLATHVSKGVSARCIARMSGIIPRCELSVACKRNFFTGRVEWYVVMSATTSKNDESRLQLGHLSGAVLKYKDADGETVVVEFEQ